MDSNTSVDPRLSASTEEIVAGLNDLLQLDHDAINSYEIAMERLENRDYASQIAGYRMDHERHVRELTELEPVNAEDPAFVALFRELRDRSAELGKRRGIPPEMLQQFMSGVTEMPWTTWE